MDGPRKSVINSSSTVCYKFNSCRYCLSDAKSLISDFGIGVFASFFGVVGFCISPLILCCFEVHFQFCKGLRGIVEMDSSRTFNQDGNTEGR